MRAGVGHCRGGARRPEPRFYSNTSHQITTAADPRGNASYCLQNAYDSRGRVITQTDGDANVWTLDYIAAKTTVHPPRVVPRSTSPIPTTACIPDRCRRTRPLSAIATPATCTASPHHPARQRRLARPQELHKVAVCRSALDSGVRSRLNPRGDKREAQLRQSLTIAAAANPPNKTCAPGPGSRSGSRRPHRRHTCDLRRGVYGAPDHDQLEPDLDCGWQPLHRRHYGHDPGWRHGGRGARSCG